MRLAFTYVKSYQTAEDIVQDVFMRAYEKRADFRGEASYKTYLYRMTINRSHDYLRSWHYKNTLLTNRIAETIHRASSTESLIVTKSEEDQLGKKVLELPVKYREVIVLYYYADYTIDEIAEILDCRTTTIKTRLRRARQRMKEKLKAKEVFLNG